MKFRKASAEEKKIDVQMTPMIDVTFLLLIFFMLTLKIAPDEGEFKINMPIDSNNQNSMDENPPYRVRLRANPDGTLANLIFLSQDLGSGENAFKRLNNEIGKMVGSLDRRIVADVEVEIQADYNLNYSEAVKAVSACTGYFSPKSKQVIRYVEKVNFAEPVKPGE